ncbi:MAG: hypothetical protein AAFQ79_01350 [Pseudomonadota bacterium]
MGVLADILLVLAALGATVYCVVLSRRLSRFTDLEKGVGGAIAVLSAQVDDMTATLRSAQTSASQSATSLGDLTGRAEDAARRLELLVASLHDLPETPAATAAKRQQGDAANQSEEEAPQETSVFVSNRARANGASV